MAFQARIPLSASRVRRGGRPGTVSRAVLRTLLVLAAISATGCKTAPPVSASARTVAQPVLVGKVREVGGRPRDDWGKAQGDIEVEVDNQEITNLSTTRTGAEVFGLQVRQQTRTCPRCPVQVRSIYVDTGAGLAASNRIEIGGDLRPPPPRTRGGR